MRGFVLALGVCSALPAAAVQYECPVTRKLDAGHVYGADALARGRFSVRLRVEGDEATIARCSYSPSVSKVDCDAYLVDRIAWDRRIGAKKFYVFASQFDFQLFKDLSFVENNGRGGIAYGTCRVVAP